MYAFREQGQNPSRKSAVVTALLEIGLAAVHTAHGIHHSEEAEMRVRLKEGMHEVIAVVDEGVDLYERIKRYAHTLFAVESTCPIVGNREDRASMRHTTEAPARLNSCVSSPTLACYCPAALSLSLPTHPHPEVYHRAHPSH